MSECRLILGDALSVLPTLPAGSVDAVITDPPYGLQFMGKSWDGGIAFRSETWATVAEPMKPGAVLLAFGGTRTFHRIACAIEDAGFKIQDTLAWMYGQGFPKHKAHLKPGWEPIILARKPGPLWLGVEECRLATADNLVTNHPGGAGNRENWRTGNKPGVEYQTGSTSGRWPANVLLTHCETCRCVGTRRVKSPVQPYVRSVDVSNNIYGKGAGNKTAGETTIGYADADGLETVDAWECDPECPVFLLDEQSGQSKTARFVQGGAPRANRGVMAERFNTEATRDRSDAVMNYGDTGGASRFFFCAKASKSDRGEGNTHPTVKPMKLMEWLCKLACPAGGTILDPFAGSGTTGVAALNTSRSFVGIEKDAGYFAIGEKRIEAARNAMPLFA